MTRYRTRPGVILAEVCGRYLLAASRGAREYCPYVTQVNESSAFLWRRMGEWTTVAELMARAGEEYEMEDEGEARSAVESFLREMDGMGYLLTEEG